jgi:hypothetical protein
MDGKRWVTVVLDFNEGLFLTKPGKLQAHCWNANLKRVEPAPQVYTCKAHN